MNNIIKYCSLAIVFVFAALNFAGCEAIGDIFKAGIWVGVIAVVAVVAIIAFIAMLFKK